MPESTITAVGYLADIEITFRRYKGMAERAMAQVSPNRINWYFHNDSNSLAILVKHISGNLVSRFTDFLRTDGEKVWRHRDVEFMDDIEDQTMLTEVWERGWTVLFNTLSELEDADLERTVYINGDGMTVREAFNRALTHQSYHIGQIVLLSKMLAPEWTSISITKKFPFHGE